MQYTDNYPFGLEHNKVATFEELDPKNNYKYNAKEWNEELGLLDYGARWYDPVLGRWGAVDPLAELQKKYNSYHYTFLNPILYNDPSGVMGQNRNDPVDGGDLPTVTVTASDPNKQSDQTASNSSFNGSFSSWQQTYGYQGYSYNGAKSEWNHLHSENYYANLAHKNAYLNQTPLGNYAEQVSELSTDAIEFTLVMVGLNTGTGRLLVQKNAFRFAQFAAKLPAKGRGSLLKGIRNNPNLKRIETLWGNKHTALESLRNFDLKNISKFKKDGATLKQIQQLKIEYKTLIPKGGRFNRTAYYRMHLMNKITKHWHKY